MSSSISNSIKYSDSLYLNDTFFVGANLYKMLNFENANNKDYIIEIFQIDKSTILLILNPNYNRQIFENVSEIVNKRIEIFYSSFKNHIDVKREINKDAPYLTGFYTANDSIIIPSYIVRLYEENKKDNINSNDVEYVSISNVGNEDVNSYFLNFKTQKIISVIKSYMDLSDVKAYKIILTNNLCDYKFPNKKIDFIEEQCSRNFVSLNFDNASLKYIKYINSNYLIESLVKKNFDTYHVMNQ